MYVRTVQANTKQGPAEYVQLCHNHYDRGKRGSRTEVLYNFGRADQLDVAALRRLVRSISRFLEPEEAEEIQARLGEECPFQFLGSRLLGGPWLLERLWEQLAIGRTLQELLRKRRYATPIERLIFALVANRALAPGSKLSMEHWVAEEAYIEGLPEVEVHQLYRAMDFLLEAAEEIQRAVFFSVAELFNLECDLLFLDTTTIHFEIEEEDLADEEERGFRQRGRSQDLPEAVIGLAMTREGLPVRCWVWPGNTVDAKVVEEVKRDLNGWHLGRIITVLDTGFNSEDNRRTLQGAGGHYIIGERLRAGKEGLPVEALRRGGKYKRVDEGLLRKEVVLGDGPARQRFVVVRNLKEAERARHRRREIVAELERRLGGLGELRGEPHKKAVCELRAHPVYGRYLRQTKTGKLRVDKAKIRREEQLDGKFLIRVSDDRLSAEDAALGYKSLSQIEHAFWDLKHVIDLRPVYHRLEDRIRAHVLLCWLALFLIRVAENATGETWRRMRKTLSTLKLGIHETRSGEVWQTSPLTQEHKDLFTELGLKPPPRYLRLPNPTKQRS